MCYIMSLNASVVVNRQAWTWQWTTGIRTLGTSPYTTHVHPPTRLLQIEQGNTRSPSRLQVECFHKLQLPIEAHHGMYVHEHRYTTANYVQTHLNFSCFQVLFSGPDLTTSVYLFHAHTYVLYVRTCIIIHIIFKTVHIFHLLCMTLDHVYVQRCILR